MLQCAECLTRYADGTHACPLDGGALLTVAPAGDYGHGVTPHLSVQAPIGRSSIGPDSADADDTLVGEVLGGKLKVEGQHHARELAARRGLCDRCRLDAGVGREAELDVVAGYAVNKFVNLEAGYGHFFVGKYIEQTWSSTATPGFGAVDADWFYVQTVIRF